MESNTKDTPHPQDRPHPQDGQDTEREKELPALLKVRREKLAELQEQGLDPFAVTKYDRDTNAADVTARFDELENKEVSIAGRILAYRGKGKVAFIDVADQSGRTQVYVKSDDIGQQEFARFKKLDIGDIIGVKGMVFRTKMGEPSIHASSYTLLTKSLQILPEKWHGLKDTDLRYRQRYVDLIVNKDVRDTMLKRSAILTEIRRILDEMGFVEVETPVLHTIAGGASARPFVTHHNTLDIDMYLRISLELYLKRLIVGGMEKVYEMGRVFRNEGMDMRHNPEFTLLELYEAYTDLEGMMALSERMFSGCAQKVFSGTKFSYQGAEIDFTPPFRRLSMADAVAEVTGENLLSMDALQAREAAKRAGVPVEKDAAWGNVLAAMFEERVEKTLVAPTFITDHPVEISPLAKKKSDDLRLTQRFELFVNGWEMANAFAELNDPIDQRERFQHQVGLRAKGDEEAMPMDEDFINALEYGMPPTGGIGFGIDRLVMLLTDSATIRDVLLFPTMKPLG